MFITQLLNRASSMMWAAIKKKKNITPAAMRHQHQMYVHFPHRTMDEMKKDKGQTFEGLSSERPKNKQDKVLKDKKVVDKMKKGQSKKSKTVRGQKASRTMW